MKNKCFLIGLFLCFFYTTDVFSQDFVKIYGEVTSNTNKPIEGAILTAKHQYPRPTTDKNGRFEMFIFGIDTITVTHIGFQPATRIIDDKLDSVLRITMKPIIELKKNRKNRKAFKKHN